jgi:uncharacterized membrane protein
MRFAVALPWWGYVAAFAAAIAGAWLAYRRVAVPLTRGQRMLLTACRALTLALIVAFLLRPVRWVEVAGVRDSVVAVLVDTSRSMRLADDGVARIEQARVIAGQLLARVGATYRTELLTFGEMLARADVSRLAAEARRSDLSSALSALADRFRGERLAAVIVLSDGGDTSTREAGATRPLNLPVFTVGIGRTSLPRDREVTNLTSGEPLLSQASVDLSVTAMSTGFGTAPFQLRLTENGRPIEIRRVTPPADGSPVHQVFTVSPSPGSATLYAVDIPVEGGELVAENNVRRVLVPAERRRRLVLVVEGAPGFEHTFLKRALARDQALDVDSVVRKGRDEEGRDTFFIQAAASRTASLSAGYPVRRADLFVYDAVLFGNIPAHAFTRDQLEMTADFVATRGGGALVFGARSFERAGLAGTPLAEVLPLDPTDRRPADIQAAEATLSGAHVPVLTVDGVLHPATRLAATPEQNRQRWIRLPPLASVAEVGSPRPGAQVLAAARDAGGVLRPLISTQRYGVGRSMVFTGEASWRWRMMLPASDPSHELVWRQLVRWLASGSSERIEVPPVSVSLPGTTEAVSVLVRDDEFKPIVNAEVGVRIAEPGGQERSVPAALSDPREGRYTASVRFDQPGAYTITAEVRRGSEALGRATRAMLVGGADVELSDPRLNEAVLRRIAEATGGRYVPAQYAGSLPALLRDSGIGHPPMEMRDLWHTGWSFAVVVGLLALEWIGRRRVGLA